MKFWHSLHRIALALQPYRRLLALAVGLLAILLSPAGWYAAPLLFGAVLLDDVNTITTKDIMPGVADNFFRSGPVTAYLKNRFTRKWVGPQIQESYLYKPFKGGAYKKGGVFDTTKRQVASGILFTPRYLTA